MTDSSASRPLLHADDLIGCRYRLSLDLRDGRLVASSHRHVHRLPTAIASIPGLYTVEPGPDASLDTLEAIARGEDVIAGAVLLRERPMPGRVYSGIDEICHPDLLVKIDDAPHAPGPTYMPVLVVTRHLLSARKANRRRKAPSSRANGRSPVQARLLSVDRLGRQGVLGRTVRDSIIGADEYKLRHHGPDAVALGQAAAMLHRLGVSSGMVGAISATGMNLDARHIVIAEEGSRVASYRMALRDARDAVAATQGRPSRFTLGTWPLAPRRIRECRTCRHHDYCFKELTAHDDISLLLPGDKSMRLRSSGINTVTALARADTSVPHVSNEQVWLARARLADVEALRVTKKTSAPRADVEMDIDMEAYPNDGAYLWGTWVPGEDYRGFVTWEPPGPEGLGGTAEARNFAIFWDYLMSRRNAAVARGETFRAYCWAAEGENYWLRTTARKFGGQEFEVPVDSAAAAGIAGTDGIDGTEGLTKIVRVPTRQEVDKFIGSAEWVDMLKITRRQIISPVGMGLKVVAPWSGFHWRDSDVNGEASLDLYRIATATDLDFVVEQDFEKLSQTEARAMLLRYNGDDCRSVAHVRDWLDSQRAMEDLPHGKDLPIP
ncbi:MAG: ribonuclease H-like domain-containing protein [Corynebacterium sp.]|uniref:ribonuclease H-like domain-containing protein n=1 Tax=Corynebacterium sp. TaxID=1720 RepID=UPI0026DCBEE3|nr:ribonuclease H-like domain-containing protein [Corynebacterium sp.]MDO5029987.1 ribonuclease H-like domain-containing protein [Corynebacterium sp.]